MAHSACSPLSTTPTRKVRNWADAALAVWPVAPPPLVALLAAGPIFFPFPRKVRNAARPSALARKDSPMRRHRYRGPPPAREAPRSSDLISSGVVLACLAAWERVANWRSPKALRKRRVVPCVGGIQQRELRLWARRNRTAQIPKTKKRSRESKSSTRVCLFRYTQKPKTF